MPATHLRRSRLQTYLQAALLGGLLVMCGGLYAADPPVPGDTPGGSAGDPAPKEAVQCIHGCQRWGKLCNVDPRGVYKCRKTCEKFGEICE